jgi:dipeptidyl aminopeptidase/acylaminoacyl peptidase
MAGIAVGALLAALAAPAAAAPVDLADVLAFATVREMAISPDGRRAAVPVRRGDLEAGAYRTEVWSVELAGSGRRAASHPRRRRRVEPALVAVRRGDRLRVEARRARAGVGAARGGGEARPLTSHGESVSGFEWSPDGARLLVRRAAPETDQEAQRRRQKDDARADGWQWRRDQLWLVPVAGGRPPPSRMDRATCRRRRGRPTGSVSRS